MAEDVIFEEMLPSSIGGVEVEDGSVFVELLLEDGSLWRILFKKDLVRFIEDDVLAVAIEEEDVVDSASDVALHSVVEEVVELFVEDKDEIDEIERCDILSAFCGTVIPEDEDDI